MKKHLKTTISLFFFAMVGAPLMLLRRLRGGRPPVVVLYYHAVPAGSAARFQRQMAMLARLARVVPADCGAADIAANPGWMPNIAITFDDALVSVFDNALPVLASFGFPCAIFVPSACLGGLPPWPAEATMHAEPVATADRVRQASSTLVTIGSHTRSHPDLTRRAASFITDELTGSKQDLRSLTNRDPTLLAFPFGRHNDIVVALCRDAGYAHVFTTQPQPFDAARGNFVRGRVAVEPNENRLSFFLKASGSYRWMVLVSRWKRRLLHRGG